MRCLGGKGDRHHLPERPRRVLRTNGACPVFPGRKGDCCHVYCPISRLPDSDVAADFAHGHRAGRRACCTSCPGRRVGPVRSRLHRQGRRRAKDRHGDNAHFLGRPCDRRGTALPLDRGRVERRDGRRRQRGEKRSDLQAPDPREVAGRRAIAAGSRGTRLVAARVRAPVEKLRDPRATDTPLPVILSGPWQDVEPWRRPRSRAPSASFRA